MIVKHNPDQLNKRAQPQTKSFHSINEIPTKVETEKVIKESVQMPKQGIKKAMKNIQVNLQKEGKSPTKTHQNDQA